MARSDERKFILFPRGQVRDEVILAAFRIALRALINPETLTFFTEDEIARATAEGGRFFVEADAIDLFGQAAQSRASFFADQVDPRKAATPFLENVHGFLWGTTRLAATGGSGPANASADVGTIYVGSTTIGDPSAHVVRDPAGKRYQVATTTATPASKVAALTFLGVDTGKLTNPKSGTILTWVAPPLGSQPTCTVSADFSGGFDVESDAGLSERIVDRIRFRPASGNTAHFRAWSREATASVETAFIYACAFHAGSVLVVPLQKRGSATGPLARIANAGTLLSVSSYVTPPGSPVVPQDVYVLTTPVVSQPSNLVLKLSMRRGSVGGWYDATPWPGYTSVKSTVQAAPAPSQTAFRINSDTTLPGGAASLSGSLAPQLMVWDLPSSRWERINVTSVTSVGGGLYDVVCTAPTHTMATGDVISPYTDRLTTVAQGVESYFDDLGPGEVVGSTDVRYTRAARFPRPSVEASTRVGSTIVSTLQDLLGGALADAELTSASVTTPSVPADPVSGPNLLTVGTVGIYSLD